MPEALICPSCGVGITGMAGDVDAIPGEAVICVSCRAIVIFGDQGGLRMPTEAEMDELLTRPDIIQSIKLVAEFHRQHGAPKAR